MAWRPYHAGGGQGGGGTPWEIMGMGHERD